MSPYLILFGGPAGAGKSTLAWAWCRTRVRSVQLELDQVRASIVGGYVDPTEASPEQTQQYEEAVRACCALARSFLAEGYDVTIDDLLSRDAYEAVWRPALGETEHSIVILQPQLRTALDRADARDKRVSESQVVSQHQAADKWPREVRVDTTGLTVEASLRLAAERGLLPD